MATRDKRIEAMRRNPRSVRFEEPRAVLEGLGFSSRPGKGDHWRFHHPSRPHFLTIDARRPMLLVGYVKEALKEIDAVLAEEE